MTNDYGNLGIIYQTRGQLENAEDYFQKALEINKALGSQEGMAINNECLGILFEKLAQIDKACD